MLLGVGLLLLGIGLLLAGKTLVSVKVLGISALVLAIALSSNGSTKALIIAIAAVICSGFLAFQVARNEITGTAVYFHSQGRGGWEEPVTRDQSATKFHHATNFKWGLSILTALVAFGGFVFYRKLEDSEDFF